MLAPDAVERAVARQGRRCGLPGTAGGGPAGARRTRGTPRSRRRRSSGTSRLRTPQDASSARRASGEPEADAVGPRRRGRPRGQKSSISGSATSPPSASRTRSPKEANSASSLDRQVLVGDLARPVVELDRPDAQAARSASRDADRRPTWGCRCRRSGSAPTRRARRAIAAAAKFLTQTPGWNSSGWWPVTTSGAASASGALGSVEAEPARGSPRRRSSTCVPGHRAEPAGATALEVVVPAAEPVGVRGEDRGRPRPGAARPARRRRSRGPGGGGVPSTTPPGRLPARALQGRPGRPAR